MGAIQFQRVSKIFHRHTGPKLIRHHFRDWFRPDPEHDFYALKDISFGIDEGESVAIIGRNGAGKSTLLSLVCGLSRPEKGLVEVNGQLAALLELGSGFHPDLTGAENVQLNASLLGFTRARTRPLLSQLAPPGQPATFGGLYGCWPMRVSRSITLPSVGTRSARSAPTAYSTGLLRRER